MEIGQRISTSLGELLVLDIHDNYLILFNDIGKQFIKANGYGKDNKEKTFWSSGEYYKSLDELIDSINR